MTDQVPSPVPYVSDPDTGGFWDAAARGDLVVRFCAACDVPVHLPRAVCAECHGPTGWRIVAPTGTVATYTVVEQQVHPAFPAPYTVVLVELDEEPTVRLLGRLDGRHEPPIGTPMVATFDEVAPGVVVPNWRPARA